MRQYRPWKADRLATIDSGAIRASRALASLPTISFRHDDVSGTIEPAYFRSPFTPTVCANGYLGPAKIAVEMDGMPFARQLDRKLGDIPLAALEPRLRAVLGEDTIAPLLGRRCPDLRLESLTLENIKPENINPENINPENPNIEDPNIYRSSGRDPSLDTVWHFRCTIGADTIRARMFFAAADMDIIRDRFAKKPPSDPMNVPIACTMCLDRISFSSRDLYALRTGDVLSFHRESATWLRLDDWGWPIDIEKKDGAWRIIPIDPGDDPASFTLTGAPASKASFPVEPVIATLTVGACHLAAFIDGAPLLVDGMTSGNIALRIGPTTAFYAKSIPGENALQIVDQGDFSAPLMKPLARGVSFSDATPETSPAISPETYSDPASETSRGIASETPQDTYSGPALDTIARKNAPITAQDTGGGGGGPSSIKE